MKFRLPHLRTPANDAAILIANAELALVNEIASSGQLKMSYLRWALFTVPAIVAVGSIIGVMSNSGYSNNWFVALDRPSIVPPGWVFGVAWTILYALMGLAVAVVLNARGARGRGAALAAFAVQLIANFCWSPLFFGAHQVSAALYLVIFILIAASVTTWLFWKVRRHAGLMLLPYLAWLCFASWLNFSIDQRNPDAETLAPPVASTNIG